MEREALKRIAEKLRRAGASIPAPQVTGTIEGSVVSGLCVALAIVEGEIEALVQPAQERASPCARHCEAQAFKIEIRTLKAQLAKPAQEPVAREWNFCERCGKRTADKTVIHTCTPPQEKNG